MFYGVKITSGLSDWQVVQRREGCASIRLKGVWRLEPGAVEAGVSAATPVIRCLREQDQSQVFSWQPADVITGDGIQGEWEAAVVLPQGGLYRLETSLDAVSAANGEHWMFRGDIRVHVGVGDVFVIAGQSNAAGYAKGVAFDPPDMRVHLLRNRGLWDMAVHPMNDATDAPDCMNAPMGITGTSPFLSFGRRYADCAGVPVGLIQAAQGGSPIKRWDNARDGDLLRNMLDKMDRCGGACAVLWYQGCADANAEDASAYAQSFERMVSAVRAHAGWTIPFFTMQLNKFTLQEDAQSWARIKEAQRQAAERLEAVWLLPTATLPLSDEIHNSAAGNVMLGEMLARQAHGALAGGPPFEAPALETVRATAEGLRLTFRHATALVCLNGRCDKADFALRDENGPVPIKAVRMDGGALIVLPAAALKGKTFVSYGCDPMSPQGPIVDQHTWLPLISFYDVEVSR